MQRYWLLRGAIAAFCLGGFLSPASAITYRVTDLGDLPGGSNDSIAFDINDAGQVVGQSNAAAGNTAFLWQSGTGIQSLGTLPGSFGSRADGINNLGEIVGYSNYGFGGTRAFIWNDGTGLSDLGGVLDGANDINDAGQIAGWKGSNSILWQQEVGPVNTGGGSGQAVATNSSGQVAGENAFGSNTARASFWDKSLGASQINDAGIGISYDINDFGGVVGLAQFSPVISHAFSWQADTGITDLGVLSPSDNDSRAYGINNAGVIVGESGRDSPRAVVWMPGSGIQDLNTLLDESGAGWTIKTARAINSSGQIVGQGLGPNGLHAVLLTPVPEPSSLVLTALGVAALMALGLRSRRHA